MKLISSAFHEGRDIPAQYTCTGRDESPPLSWDQVPEKTVSFVLLCENPASVQGLWVHWLVYNLPKNKQALQAGEPIPLEHLGLNSWGRQIYNGPCPPNAHDHTSKDRYYFRLYALDTFLSFTSLGRPPRKGEIEKAMEGHKLAIASLFGHFHTRHEGFERPHPSKTQPGGYHGKPFV